MSHSYIDPLLNSELQELKEELKLSHRLEFGEIKTSPLDAESLKKLEQIYVHPALLNERTDENPEPVDYEKLFEILVNEEGKSRFVFIGEAGVGKTTLLRKIAYDWAIGERLQHVDLLFFVPLRDVDKSSYFAEIITQYVSDGIDLDNDKFDQYMRKNQRKVMVLLDGLDEYKQDIKIKNANDILVAIMRGDKLIRAPVIVTTRPWRVEQITSNGRVNKLYERVRVEGFTKHDVQVYIQKFFTNDSEAAQSLIRLATENDVIAKAMAPYPIFCCMLCHMWKWIKASDRDGIRKLQTYSELIHEIVNALIEQHASKVREEGESLKDCQVRCKDSLKRIGEVAFNGLLEKQLAFDENAFKDCMADVKTGCEIGVLSSKKKFASSEIRRRDGSELLLVVSFPHKLLQEYLAGIYFASLYLSDKLQFERVLRDKILQKSREYEYLLYFTAAHGKEPGQAGQPLIETLCGSLTIELDRICKNQSLITDVAFECHAEITLPPVVDLLSQKTAIILYSTVPTINYTEHTLLGYMFVLAVCGRKTVRINSITLFSSNQRRTGHGAEGAAAPSP